MKNYEKPIAEVLLFRLAEVRMVPRISIGEGTDDNYAKKHNGSGDWDGDTFFNFDTKENPWPVVEGFTGNGFYLNPGAPNGRRLRRTPPQRKRSVSSHITGNPPMPTWPDSSSPALPLSPKTKSAKN